VVKHGLRLVKYGWRPSIAILWYAWDAGRRGDGFHKPYRGARYSEKEARESFYWLRLIADSHGVSNSRLRALTQETGELVAVITGIVANTKFKKVA